MTTNPTESQPAPVESQEIPAIVEVRITVDHVYLPLAEPRIVGSDWAVTSNETSRIARGERLLVPGDLAKLLIKRSQAEILSSPLPSAAPGTGEAGL